MSRESVLNKTEIDSRMAAPSDGPRVLPDESEMSLLEICRVLLREKLFILRFAVVAAVLTEFIVLIMRPYYTGQASFLPPNSMSNGGSSALLGQLGAIGMSAAGSALGGLGKDPSLIYIGVLGSRSVADDLIRQFDL